MTDRTAADRMARKRQRDREAGLTEVLIKVPVNRKQEILAIAKQMRDAAHQGAPVMTTAQQIRQHLDHGRGTREVRIRQNGEVHIRGSVDELDHSGWKFAGYVDDLLQEIEREKSI